MQKGGAGGDGEGDLKNWSQRPQRVPSCQFQAASAHQAIIKNTWHEKPKDWLLCRITGRSCHKYIFCHDKHVFVATKHVFCHDKSMLLLYLPRQTKFCCDKSFVVTFFCGGKKYLSQQTFCHNRHNSVTTKLLSR